MCHKSTLYGNIRSSRTYFFALHTITDQSESRSPASTLVSALARHAPPLLDHTTFPSSGSQLAPPGRAPEGIRRAYLGLHTLYRLYSAAPLTHLLQLQLFNGTHEADVDSVGATGLSPAPPACDTGLFEQPGAPNHCACGEESIFNIDKAKVHLGNCCAPDVVASVSGKATCSDSSKCCISAATEIPVYTLGLAARQHAEKSFATSLESYVPPGSR